MKIKSLFIFLAIFIALALSNINKEEEEIGNNIGQENDNLNEEIEKIIQGSDEGQEPGEEPEEDEEQEEDSSENDLNLTDAIPYSIMIQKLNQNSIINKQYFYIVEQKDFVTAINSTITLFTEIFSGMKQCDERSNKAQFINFLNTLNYPFGEERKFNKTYNMITLCDTIYEIYYSTIQLIQQIQNNSNELAPELKQLFTILLSDYEGLKEAGLFDQIIYIEDVILTNQSELPQFEIQFVEYEEFEEMMSQYVSLIQAINAIFEGKSREIVWELYNEIDINEEEYKDIQKLEKKYVSHYWNKIKQAVMRMKNVKQGWKKLYYQTTMSIAYKLRDQCHYFDKEGIIINLQRNSESKNYLPIIECERKNTEL